MIIFRLLTWYQARKTTPNIWINTDLVHFNLGTDGATIFATTVKDAVEASANRPIKNWIKMSRKIELVLDWI